jgi:NhaP-type Na+/H+ or K+/H+ antiporter
MARISNNIIKIKNKNMKKFKKTLGIGLISILFLGLFGWMAQDSSIKIALTVYGITLGIVVVVCLGVWLFYSD